MIFFVLFDIKNLNQCLHKFYLEYISVGVHNNMDDDGEPPAKRSRYPMNTYNIGIKRPG